MLEFLGAAAAGGLAVLIVGVAASLVISGRESRHEEKYWSDYRKGGR